MFSKASKLQPNVSTNSSIKGDVPPSIIAADMRINGDLLCSGAIHVDGRIDGDVQSREIVVGETATIHGNLQGEMVRICGSVEGQIKADNVYLTKTARVRGDILHKAIAIEQGAFLEGMCKRLESKPNLIPTEIKPHLGLESSEKALAVG